MYKQLFDYCQDFSTVAIDLPFVNEQTAVRLLPKPINCSYRLTVANELPVLGGRDLEELLVPYLRVDGEVPPG